MARGECERRRCRSVANVGSRMSVFFTGSSHGRIQRMAFSKVQQGLLDRLPQTCGGDWSHRLRGRDDTEGCCRTENIMRNCGIPLQRRVELHCYLFWIYSGRAVMTATNVLKKKVKPTSGDVVVDKALRDAYVKVEKSSE